MAANSASIPIDSTAKVRAAPNTGSVIKILNPMAMVKGIGY